MRVPVCVALVLLLVAPAALCVPVEYYITTQVGTLPIILTTPHGGSDLAAYPNGTQFIADRTDGCLVNGACVWTKSCTPKSHASCEAKTLADSYTIALADTVAAELLALTGKRPFRVNELLHRKKLDVNRPRDEAAQGDETAGAAWDSYHNAVASYCATVAGQCPKGALLVDIHGQNHTDKWVEIGYDLTIGDLHLTNPTLDGATYVQKSSIRHVAGFSNNAPFSTLVRGQGSIGQMLNDAYATFPGYNTVPSPSIPDPTGHEYYDGGYTTTTYGSHNGGLVDSFQVETPLTIRSDATTRTQFGKKLARVIVDWMNVKYPYTLASTSGNRCWGAYMEGIVSRPPVTTAAVQTVLEPAGRVTSEMLQPNESF